MTLRMTLTVLVLTVLPATAQAAILEVPVPAFEGHYVNDHRIITFTLPGRPVAIRSMSVRVRGTSTFGIYTCNGGPFAPRPFPISIEVFWNAQPGWWSAMIQTQTPGAVDAVQAMVPYDNPTWAFLLDGTGELWIAERGQPETPGCFIIGDDGTAEINDVTLLIDGDCPTPAGDATWGRIKAAYR